MNKWLVIRSISKTLTLSLSSRPFCSQPTSSTFAVKKVTKSNFDSALQLLTHHIQNADFVSIDLEMTGITSAPWREIFEFDRSDVRYLKIKDSVDKFAVVQFGVCPFRWDSSKESFIAHPHTFYVFPRKEIAVSSPSYEFLCQTASLEFLAKYQFDFNACIYEGISYLSRAQEGEALDRLNAACEVGLSNSQCNSNEDIDIPSVGIADVLFTERMKNRFREWSTGLLRNTDGKSQFQGNSIDSKAQLQTVFFKMRPALELNGFTSHQLRLIQLVIRKHFRDLTYIRLNGENASERKLIVYTDSDDDKHLLLKDVKDTKRKEAEMKVKAAVGFRHLIDLLSSEQKLIVGHNCFLDVAHVHSKFLGPLPSTIEEYASSIHGHFPFIIDTKYLLNTDSGLQFKMNNSSTSLSKAYAFLCAQISSVWQNSSVVNPHSVKFEVQVDDMRSSNWNSGASHEAGYDAFMTGCVFAQVCSHLGIDFKLHSPIKRLADIESLQKYINHLYVSWRNGSIVNLSTGQETPESSIRQKKKQRHPNLVFENIVLLWGFSPSLKPGILQECLSKVFGLGSVTSIYYLDKTAAFIQFNKKELVSDFLALMETLEKKNDPISVLHPLQKILQDGHIHAAGYEVYKEICRSSISNILFSEQANAVDFKRMTKEEKESKEEVENHEAQCSVIGGNVDSNSLTNTETVQSCGESKKESSNLRFSCVELMDALCNPDSLPDKHSRT